MFSVDFSRADVCGIYFSGHDNHIVLRAKEDTDEDYIMYILLHELDHWAQDMYLDFKDRTTNTIRHSTATKPVPFVERINRYPTKGWGMKEER
jgi:hypothetical protein